MSSGAIAWYDHHGSTLVDTYEGLDFKAAHGWLLDLLPERPGLILDVGAGSGRDAAGLAAIGHEVVAVEPSSSMLREGSVRHEDARIRWLDDRLPALDATHRTGLTFDLTLHIAFGALGGLIAAKIVGALIRAQIPQMADVAQRDES